MQKRRNAGGEFAVVLVVQASWLAGFLSHSVLPAVVPVLLLCTVGWRGLTGIAEPAKALDIERATIAGLVVVIPQMILGGMARPEIHEIEAGGMWVIGMLSPFAILVTALPARFLVWALPQGRRWRLAVPVAAMALAAVTALVIADCLPSRWTRLPADGSPIEIRGVGTSRVLLRVDPSTRIEPCPYSKWACSLLSYYAKSDYLRGHPALLVEVKGERGPDVHLVPGGEAWVGVAGRQRRARVCTEGPWRGRCAELGWSAHSSRGMGPVPRSWFLLPLVGFAAAAFFVRAAWRERRGAAELVAGSFLANARADVFRAIALLAIVYVGTPFVMAAWAIR